MLLTTVYSVLQQPFKLSSLNGHEPEKCFGKQELHADWPKANDGSYYVVNSIWMLDDFSISNGATRVIPKSHKILGKVLVQTCNKRHLKYSVLLTSHN